MNWFFGYKGRTFKLDLRTLEIIEVSGGKGESGLRVRYKLSALKKGLELNLVEPKNFSHGIARYRLDGSVIGLSRLTLDIWLDHNLSPIPMQDVLQKEVGAGRAKYINDFKDYNENFQKFKLWGVLFQAEQCRWEDHSPLFNTLGAYQM